MKKRKLEKNSTAIVWLVAGIFVLLLLPTILVAIGIGGTLLAPFAITGMAWMAWTWPTAIFFLVIACLLVTFTILAIKYPETPRTGILRIETTRGDRLFITLLGSAFINLIWLGLEVAPQPYALLACLVYAAAVFRWV